MKRAEADLEPRGSVQARLMNGGVEPCYVI
jgi:hypothetical protein